MMICKFMRLYLRKRFLKCDIGHNVDLVSNVNDDDGQNDKIKKINVPSINLSDIFLFRANKHKKTLRTSLTSMIQKFYNSTLIIRPL